MPPLLLFFKSSGKACTLYMSFGLGQKVVRYGTVALQKVVLALFGKQRKILFLFCVVVSYNRSCKFKKCDSYYVPPEGGGEGGEDHLDRFWLLTASSTLLTKTPPVDI